ncbi:MAG: alcohol dehydrogenase [SAR202 cluster bacterium Io17-Chloro-G7]|nr:MAG: alcohol dehydrogenase [SAR202 cluster bacterium Io17-Chloro-G7]
MKAVWYEQNGDAGVLNIGDMPDPEPGPEEVRIRIVSSGINPSDWKRRQGLTATMGHPRVVPHQDGAGVIDQVGSGVPANRVGERVWLYQCQIGRPYGTAAEYTVQPAIRAVPLHANVNFTQGACLGVPAMTAHRCLFADGPVAGKTVFVPGGAGAVGNYAIQLAKLDGAQVISTVSSDEKASIAKSAGASHVVNYRTEDVVSRILEVTDGAGVDHIVEVDFAGNFKISQQILKANSVLAVYAAGTPPQPPVPLQFNVSNVNVRLVLVYDMPEPAKTAAVEDINRLVEQNKLSHLLGPRFSLDTAAEAHRAVEGGAIGNVTLDVGTGD